MQRTRRKCQITWCLITVYETDSGSESLTLIIESKLMSLLQLLRESSVNGETIYLWFVFLYCRLTYFPKFSSFPLHFGFETRHHILDIASDHERSDGTCWILLPMLLHTVYDNADPFIRHNWRHFGRW